MGNQATVIILTDQLDLISKDPNFAQNLVQAILKVKRTCYYKDPVELYAHANHCSANVGSVVECHNCDSSVMIVAGGGYARKFAWVGGDGFTDPDQKVEALKRVVTDMGYTLRKKAVKKPKYPLTEA